MKLLQRLANESTFVIPAKWCTKENYLKPMSMMGMTEDFGIYVIADQHNILKIGKASGKQGLKQRVSDYFNPSYFNSPDRIKRDKTVGRVKSILSENPNELLFVYGVSLKQKVTTVYDSILQAEVQCDPTRDYEKQITAIAMEEEHTLTLMRQKR